MSRRRRQDDEGDQQHSRAFEAVEDDSTDDELARELEEERQKLLAASGNNDHELEVNSEEEDEDDGVVYGDQDEQEDMDVDHVPDEDDSEDEWQPPEPAAKKATRKSQRKRARRGSSTEDSDEDLGQELSEDEVAPASKKSKKATTGKTNGSNKKLNGRSEKGKTPAHDADRDDEQADESFDEEAERVQAEVEAAAAWADVRKRKEAAAASQASSSTSAPKDTAAKPPSLSAWLGKGPSASSSVSELAASLPMPTSCPGAQIVDRNSLFVGYVYPLTTASSAYISTLLSHLTRVVHPTVPVDLLPPQFANAPASKRGASHDMYAYRVLELKRGRSGLGGPDDFSLQEDKEDDGEKWGGDRVLRVAREEGASDVLVVVSRWYGGELLGPVRFDHIENAARATLQEHMSREEVDEFRQRIQHLDRKIAQTKEKLKGGESSVGAMEVNRYEDLTVERGQRLWLARQKALDALQKRVAGLETQASQASTQEDGPPLATVEDISAEPTAEPTAEEPSTAPIAIANEDASAIESDSATIKEEPQPTLLDAAVESDHKPNTEATVLDDLSETDTRLVKTEPTEGTIKSEPTEASITPLAAPIRVKDEHPELTLPPPPIPNLKSEKQEDEEQEDDKKTQVKLEPTDGDGDAHDLTGWDDLA